MFEPTRPSDKPRLVFFRQVRNGLPRYIQFHLQEQVACLSHFFDVFLIDRDCDYGEICEKYKADLSLFESGIYKGNQNISNVSAHPEIPKIGFCHADAYCSTRSTFISDMEKLGIQSFFTTSTTMADYTCDISDRLFVWPNFVDPNIFQDYGNAKNIPVLFTGSQAAHYPWRNQVRQIVSAQYPSLICPHHGWYDDRRGGKLLHGAEYARLLNSAYIIPTCGTIANDVVRKHLEIPAAGSLLLTQRTPAIVSAGFKHMENCVFAEPSEVLDTIDYLFAHPNEIARITENGYKMVHSDHTINKRDQILQWFRLYKSLGPDQRIIQDGPFNLLRIVPAKSGVRITHVDSCSVDRKLLRLGDESLCRGHYQKAERFYNQCLTYHSMPEPLLRIARARLFHGDATGALDCVSKLIDQSLHENSGSTPDPVAWAYFIRALLGLGRIKEASRRANQFRTLNHTELNRMQSVISYLAESVNEDDINSVRPRTGSHSVHVLPPLSDDAWFSELTRMLNACGQSAIASRLAKFTFPQTMSNLGKAAPEGRYSIRHLNGPQNITRGPLKLYVRRNIRTLRMALKKIYSWRQCAGPHLALETLARTGTFSKAIILGSGRLDPSTEMLIAGLRANPRVPDVFLCLNLNAATVPRELGDMIVVTSDAYAKSYTPPAEDLFGASTIVLVGSRSVCSDLQTLLSSNSEYQLVLNDPSGEGWAVYQRTHVRRDQLSLKRINGQASESEVATVRNPAIVN
jgi:hypothetical protein